MDCSIFLKGMKVYIVKSTNKQEKENEKEEGKSSSYALGYQVMYAC